MDRVRAQVPSAVGRVVGALGLTSMLGGLAVLARALIHTRPTDDQSDDQSDDHAATTHAAITPSSDERKNATRANGLTRGQLYEEAKRMDIAGRSTMNKAQLQRAVERANVAR